MMGLLINSLGRIKTSFLHLTDFWHLQLLQSQILADLNTQTKESIANVKEETDLDGAAIDVFVEQSQEHIHETTLRWITLFKINHDASTYIKVC